MNSIDFIEGNFKLVQIFILFDFKLSFISLEKSNVFKSFSQILIAHFGNFFEKEDKIVNFSEFIINLFKYLVNNCFNEYPKLDSIKINLKTNHKVISTNADSKHGYHYTWNLTREKKDDAAILITLSKNKYVFNYENEFIKRY